MTATRGPAFTTAMRVIDRVHDHAADLGSAAQPARTTRLADDDIGILGQN